MLLACAATPAWATDADEPTVPTLTPFGRVRTQLGMDTAYESAPGDPAGEQVLDGRLRLELGVETQPSEETRVRVEGRLRARGLAQRGLRDGRSELEPYLGETYLDLYTGVADFRLGNQVFAFGANAFLSPVDRLNPFDLREGLLLVELEDVKLPTPGLRGTGELGPVRWTVAYVPLFRPTRLDVAGTDEAVLQPALGLFPPEALQDGLAAATAPYLGEVQEPRATPWNGELGLRVAVDVWDTRLGASFVDLREGLPWLELDPALAAYLLRVAQGGAPEPRTVRGFQARAAAGETLVQGHHERSRVLGLDAQRLLGSAQLDVEVAFTPARTVWDGDLSPQRKAAWSWTVGVSQAAESDWLYAFTYAGTLVPEVDVDGVVRIAEPDAEPGRYRSLQAHVLLGVLARRFQEGRLELMLRAMGEPLRRSFALAPTARLRTGERSSLLVGAELYQGPTFSPFGYFRRNDQVLARFEYALF